MVRASCVLICCLLGALLLVMPAAAYPSIGNYYRPAAYQYQYQYEPEQIMDMINRLNDIIDVDRKMETLKEEIIDNHIPISSEKRGLDMGLSRGFSAGLQAKHLMGVAAANFAGGPGRRRRSYE